MYTLITDGGHRKDITYGSYKLYDERGKLIIHKQLVFGYGTSNLAEYLTMIVALRRTLDKSVENVVILTDSLLLKNQVEGLSQCNYPHLIQARNRVRNLLNCFYSWKIVKVKRNIIVAHLGH